MELTSDNVEAILVDCLHEEGDPEDRSDVVPGILHDYKFHAERLESHREDIRSMIEQLPTEFQKNGGGGWSFLNLCMRDDGVQWTSYHLRQEQLYSLAAGLGMAQIQLPRELWSVLPGSVPYIVFDVEGKLNAKAAKES